MQSLLQSKLKEIEANKHTTSKSPKKLSLLDFNFDTDFKNKSWVDIIDEEERRNSRTVSEENVAEEKAGSESIMVVTEQVEIVSSSPAAKENLGTNQQSTPNTNSKLLPKPKEGWSEPTKGWCQDDKAILRREKEIKKMKERSTYKRFLSEIPKFARKKHIHPRTPNKYLNWSRRSWDSQIKKWKLAIYEWAGETPTSSVCASYCPSECSDVDNNGNRSASASPVGHHSTVKRLKLDFEEEKKEEDVMENATNTSSNSKTASKRANTEQDGLKQLQDDKPMQKRIKLETHNANQKPAAKSARGKKLFNEVTIPTNPEAMASLLDHFDFDSLREAPTLTGPSEEESTLKCMPNNKSIGIVTHKSYAQAATAVKKAILVNGPTDFSEMVPIKTDCEVIVNANVVAVGKKKEKRGKRK